MDQPRKRNCIMPLSGQIGNMRYELRCVNEIDNTCEVVVFGQGMGLTIVQNSSYITCLAFIEGMKVGKCKSLASIANKNLGFDEYSRSAKDGEN